MYTAGVVVALGTSNGVIVDETGQEVALKGINWWASLPDLLRFPFLTEIVVQIQA